MDHSHLNSKSVKELKQILKDRGVDSSGCIEKEDLIAKVIETKPKEGVVRETDQRIGSLDCTVLQNTENPETIVIISHGFGANADDLVSIGHSLIKVVQKKILFVFPNAPITLDHGGLAWWHIDIQKLYMRGLAGELTAITKETPEGLDEATEKIVEVINYLKSKYNVPLNKFVISGFSQGAMLSTNVALTLDGEVGGLGIFSGSLICASKWEELAKSKTNIKVLQSHGKTDQILPFFLGSSLRDLLKKCGMNVDFVQFGGPHTIPQEAIAKFVQLVSQI
eukprot:TRINITY_DN8859_c0_g1_i1.p1 TRINITY_DN8859_c0_g1~~TRINITY_DN8859_c0_g1_i1.p1  ORF type:complete len:309 (-),score=42.19 TRINITY_DN8859_c0_g1_i1:134-973(-)